MACSCAASTISVPPTVITTTTSSNGDYVFLTGPLNTDNVLTLVVSLTAEAVGSAVSYRPVYQVSSDPTFSTGVSNDTIDATYVTGSGVQNYSKAVVSSTKGALFYRVGLEVKHSGSEAQPGLFSLAIDALPY
jgi:hypothetical protein